MERAVNCSETRKTIAGQAANAVSVALKTNTVRKVKRDFARTGEICEVISQREYQSSAINILRRNTVPDD
ncbi:hypothetical protein EAI_16171 [Harpegnathos saltator]|uniref:Uncharacterized protein n=1 Tax=Harpegnathos saltator TaxID=610380 RepID=E2BH05_HARSA|nr:hypothetical protein EAI_16171 [Harpegnathos saltator]